MAWPGLDGASRRCGAVGPGLTGFAPRPLPRPRTAPAMASGRTAHRAGSPTPASPRGGGGPSLLARAGTRAADLPAWHRLGVWGRPPDEALLDCVRQRERALGPYEAGGVDRAWLVALVALAWPGTPGCPAEAVWF
jgi:hypothetical protein